MFRRAGRELHQVEAGWSPGGTLAPTSSHSHPFLFGHFSIFCFGNGTDLYSLYFYHLQVWKRWNLHSKRRGKWVKASLMLIVLGVERSFSSSPFGKFLPKETRLDECWQTARTAATLFSVSGLSAVRRQYFLIKEDLTESFHLERRRI